MFSGKFSKKLILICVSILIVYTVFMISSWFISDATIKSKQFKEENEKIVSDIRNNIDGKIINIISLSEQLAGDKEIISFAAANDSNLYGYNTLRAVGKISERLNNFLSPDCSIGVINRNLDVVATQTKSMDTQTFIDDIGVDKKIFTDIMDKMQNTNGSRTVNIYNKRLNGSSNDSILLLMNKKLNKQNVLITMLINKKYLFEDYGLTNDNSLIFTVDGETVLIVGDTGFDYNKYLGKGINCYIAASKTFDSVKFILCSHNYRYIKDNQIFLFINFVLGILMLVVFMVLMCYILKCIYMPIGEVVNEIKEYENYDTDDEAFILKENFTNMKSNNDNLIEVIEKNRMHLREKVLTDLLYGVLNSKNLEEQVKLYSLDYLKNSISVTVIEFASIENVKNIDYSLNTFEIKDIIFKYFKKNLKFKNGAEMVEMNESQFVIVTVGYGLDEIRRFFLEELGYAEEYYGIILKSATGSICESLSEVKNSYLEAVSMLGYKGSQNKNIINILDFDYKSIYYYPLEIERNLISYVQQGDSEKTIMLLDGIIQKNYSTITDEQSMMEFKLALIATLKRLVQLFGWQTCKKNDFLFKDICINENEEKFAKKLKASFLELSSYVVETSASNINSLMSSILDYIKENYMRDISLTEIAEYFGISIGYIGKLFRENMDTTFKDYLNHYRIEVAKEVMKSDTNIMLASIAEKVGFTNAITFNRVFKKYEMITPSEYRNNYSK